MAQRFPRPRRQARQRMQQSRRPALPAAIEPLETRTLLSTINWANQGNDSFIFFGANQNVARTIVQRAIDDWERVIVDFNYDDTGPNLNNTFNLTINAASMGFGVRGSANVTARDDATDRKPTAATLTLDDDGGGLGWYFDPNIGSSFFPEDGEYTQPVNLFTANVPFPGGPTGSDFYRTVVHEIGHALGIQYSSGFLKIADFLVDSGIPDPQNPAVNLFTLNTFGGPAPEYTMTNEHLWEGDGPGGITTLPEHPNDLMNEGRTVPGGVNRRQLISDTDALLLLDVYNYQIVSPSQINTFFANLNQDTGVLTLNGDLFFGTQPQPMHLPNDFIDMEWSGTLNSTFQLSNGSVASEVIPEILYNTIIVNAGSGNDLVEVNGVASGKTVTINLGDGDDDVAFGAEGRFMSSIASNITVNGGSGSNGAAFRDDNSTTSSLWTFEFTRVIKSFRIYNLESIQSRFAFGSSVNDTFLIKEAPAGTTLNVNGNGGSESFEIGNHDLTANILSAVTITGGAGNDFIRVLDAADQPGNDVWTFSAGAVAKAGAPQIAYNTIESITVTAGVQNDRFFVNAATTAVSIDGGFGDDTFELGAGDLDNLSRVTIMGGVGDDLLIVNDALDAGNDSYNLTTAAITKPGNPEAFQAIEINTQIGVETERTQLRANGFDNAITVNSARGLEVQGNAGNDTIRVLDHAGPLPVTIDAGTGTANRLFLNEDNVGTVSAVFNTNNDQTFSELHLLGGSKLTVAEGPNGTILVTQTISLTVGGAGSLLDLNDNSMIIRSTALGGNTGFIRQRVAAGYNGGAWSGTQGITSTTARNSSAADGIGFATGGQLGRPSFNGIPIGGLDIVMDHTLLGDANLDHQVNLADFNRLASNFGQSLVDFNRGDFNYDGTANLADFNLLASNFGQMLASASTGRGASAGAEPHDDLPLLRWLLPELS